MKILIIGPSLSGKTSLVRKLRAVLKDPVSEMDEELTSLNNGKFPTDNENRKNTLSRKVIRSILNKSSIIFFTNTNYFSATDLRSAKKLDFTILLLNSSIDSLRHRNRLRVQNENYEDLSKWLVGMVDYQNKMRKFGLVDAEINSEQSVENTIKDLLKMIGLQNTKNP